MSYVVSAPQAVTAAAKDLSNIGSTIEAANAAAAAPTTGDLAVAADEVSAAVAAAFSAHAQAYQELGAQIAEFHTQFVQAVAAAGQAYAAAEADNASSLQAGVRDLLA
jgi:PE family